MSRQTMNLVLSISLRDVLTLSIVVVFVGIPCEVSSHLMIHFLYGAIFIYTLFFTAYDIGDVPITSHRV